MINFEFQNPTKIIFGKGQMDKLQSNIRHRQKFFCFTVVEASKKNGVYDGVKNALKDYSVEEFGGIPANPEYSVLIKALELIKEKKIDFLLAVGGGSVIDGTKFLACSFIPGQQSVDILAKGIRSDQAMPFGTVLTLPATGSEMNSGAVITNDALKEKRAMGGLALFPQFSILDPSVIESIPERQLANGITDAFTHVLEQYMTYPADGQLQDRFAESIFANIAGSSTESHCQPERLRSLQQFYVVLYHGPQRFDTKRRSYRLGYSRNGARVNGTIWYRPRPHIGHSVAKPLHLQLRKKKRKTSTIRSKSLGIDWGRIRK